MIILIGINDGTGPTAPRARHLASSRPPRDVRTYPMRIGPGAPAGTAAGTGRPIHAFDEAGGRGVPAGPHTCPVPRSRAHRTRMAIHL